MLQWRSALCAGYSLNGQIQAEDALNAGGAIHRENPRPKMMLIETPIQMRNVDGQASSGFIDLALETVDGSVIIDHKTFQGSGAVLTEKALSFSQANSMSTEAPSPRSAVRCIRRGSIFPPLD